MYWLPNTSKNHILETVIFPHFTLISPVEPRTLVRSKQQ